MNKIKLNNKFFFVLLILSSFANQFAIASELAVHDSTPPQAMGKVSVVEMRSNQIKVRWEPAQDNITPANQLQYRLVHSKNPKEIDQVSEIKAIIGKSVDLDWSTGNTETLINDLTPSTKYGVMLAVKDASENTTLYPMLITHSGAGFQSLVHEKRGRHSVGGKKHARSSKQSKHEQHLAIPKSGRG